MSAREIRFIGCRWKGGLTNAEVLGFDFLVETGSDGDSTTSHCADDTWHCDALRCINSGHAVGAGCVGVKGHLLQTEVADSLLDRARSVNMFGKVYLKRNRALCDSLQRGVQSHHQLYGRCGKVRRLTLVISLMNLQALLDGILFTMISVSVRTGSHFFQEAK